MPFYVYAIYSTKLNTIYIGQTEYIEKRISDHKKGYSRYTSRSDDWELFYREESQSRTETIRRERQLKSSRGRAYLWGILKRRKQQARDPLVDGSVSSLIFNPSTDGFESPR
jgi:putative endonuclease